MSNPVLYDICFVTCFSQLWYAPIGWSGLIFSALGISGLQERWYWVKTGDSIARHQFMKWLFPSSSIILSGKVSKCGLASCVYLSASTAPHKKWFIIVAKKPRPFHKASFRPAEDLWGLFSKLSYTSFPTYWLKLLMPVWKVSHQFFWNWKCSEGQLSLVHRLNRIDRVTTNFWIRR